MALSSVVRLAACLTLVGVGVGSPGCGGGGGPGPGPGIPGCTIQGTLEALALEGDPTPVGGSYAAFPSDAPISTADTGWTAFTAEVVGGATPFALFVAPPLSAPVTVYAVGDTVPSDNGGSGTIGDILRFWMRPDGVVVAHVLIAGASGEGFLTARVDAAGAVTEKVGALYLGRALPAGVLGVDPGTLTAIDPSLTQVDDAGDVFFTGTGSGIAPMRGLWRVDRLGAAVAALAVEGDPSPEGGAIGADFDGLGIDAAGAVAVFSVDIVGGIGKGLFASVGGVYAIVATDGYGPPNVGGRTFSDVHAGGPIVITYDADHVRAFATWRATLDGPDPTAGVFAKQVASEGVLWLDALRTVLGPGVPPFGLGLGFFSEVVDVSVVEGEDEPEQIVLDAAIQGGPIARVFFLTPIPEQPTILLADGERAPDGSTFGTEYPSLDVPDEDATDSQANLAFTAVLTDGSTGLFWDVLDCTLARIVGEGEVAPGAGGAVYGSFATPSTVSTARGVLAFRAALAGGPSSGLFRLD